MIKAVRFLAVVALTGSIIWFLSDPGFEPALASVGSISTLVSAFVVEKRSKRHARQQHQSVSESSVGIQANGDVSVGDINSDRHVK